MIVDSLEQLKELAQNDNSDFQEFYVLLAGGFFRSSKRILYDPKIGQFSILNEIDNSYQELLSEELSDKTNLIKAIDAKALYKYSD